MRKVLTNLIIGAIISGSFGLMPFNAPIIKTASALEDQFIVRQIVSNTDTSAPSVPTSLTATAVSTSQINLSWDASTDDFGVTGYQVFRGVDQIATSTITTYSDTGLTANTAYEYTVTAFDASLNISAHSATATATTFDDTPPPPPSGGGGGTTPSGRVDLVLRYLSVAPDLESALIRFGTNLPVQARVQWGETRDYELGSIANALYIDEHSVRLIDLKPDTRYYFKIVLVDGYYRELIVDNQEFRTLSPSDTVPPANVSNFKATPSHEDIKLTWENPKADFESIVILKSDQFYPRDPFNGEVIYEGRAEKYTDRNVVQDKTYYYTAFSKDRAGNYSSGAVTDGRLLKPGETASEPKLFAGILQLPKDMIHSLLKTFSILDVNFIQDGKKLPVVNETVDIRGDRNLTISIDYEKVPEILKTIAITMFDPEDKSKTFSFLLRVNADKTAYEAHIAALERPGKYQFALAILDYKNQGLASVAGTIFAKVPDLIPGGKSFSDTSFGLMDLLWFVLLVLLLLAIMYLVLRKKKNDQQVQVSQSVPASPVNIPTLTQVPQK